MQTVYKRFILLLSNKQKGNMHTVVKEVKQQTFNKKVTEGYWEVLVEQFGTDPSVKEVRNCVNNERFLVKVI